MKKLEIEFEQVVKQYKNTIYTVCFMFSKDSREVNDLFQDVLVNLWKGFDTFKGESNIGTWIWRVSLNTCISSDRKKKIVSVPLIMGIDLFEDRDEDTTQIKMLYNRISRLKHFDRAIVLLWLENFSYEEIAAIVGISVKNVSVRLFRIKEELKKIGFENIYNHERKIKDYLIEEMKKIDNVTIYGDTENTEDRLGVISFNIKNKDCYKVADIFAKESAVSLRAGKFCAHPYVARLLKVSNSYEEYEKNLDDADFGMVRLSIGLYNTMEEAKIFIDELKRIALDIY